MEGNAIVSSKEKRERPSQLLEEGFPGGSVGRIYLLLQETQVLSLGREDSLEKEMATHSSILAWEIPCLKNPWWVTDHGVTKS